MSVSSCPSTTPSFLLHPIAGMQEHLSHPETLVLDVLSMASSPLGHVAPNDEHGVL